MGDLQRGTARVGDIRKAIAAATSGLCSLLVLTWPLQAIGVDTVVGTKGDFRVTKTVTMPGDKIEIEYDPKTPPNTCKKILFVQSCLTKIDGTAVKPSDEDEKWKFQDDDTAKDGKTTVDSVTCETDPYYNGDDGEKDIGEPGDATAAEASDDAKMHDTPGAAIPAGKSSISYEFETCAYCADDNTFLECVTWKYTNDTTAGQSVEHNTGASAKEPSDAIQEAKKAFDNNHTKDGATFSQEATTAADGKKFSIQAFAPVFNLFSDQNHSPGLYEPGSNLMEFVQNGALGTDAILAIDILPQGSVRGVSAVGGRELLTIEVELISLSLGSLPLVGQPFQMQIAGFDPETSGSVDLVDAHVLVGGGGVIFGPFLADFSTPSLMPGTTLRLVYDVGPAPVPGLLPELLLLLAAWLAISGAFVVSRRRSLWIPRRAIR